MVEIIKYPKQAEWPEYAQRAAVADAAARLSVAEIIAEVESHGDEALKELSLKFDGCCPEVLKISREEIDNACREVSGELKKAIETAAANIEKFHAAELPKAVEVEVMPGIRCSQRAVPISRVGLYIPGGNSPLFSTVLMLAIPARLAGCREIVLCTPPRRDGTVHPAILFAAHVAGVTDIFKVGGAQAIAAMAVGTGSIRPVYKIFGPGNRYVTEAKVQAAARGVAIDMPAGPSEVMVVADCSADPVFVASDFLSQAEHGADSQSILLTTDAELADRVTEAIETLLVGLPKRDLAEKSLSHSHIILLHDDDEMMRFANYYAPEHLIINHTDADRLAAMVENAGSVFLGAYSPESAGDYASGTNHTLPTGGHARCYSGVNIDSYMKKITFQRLTHEGLASIAPTVTTMAREEGLVAHSLAVEVRINRKL